MMATAFMGYVLPWGQMSFWGVTVITSMFSAIPLVGQSVVEWLWGGFSISNATLQRFFSLHYLFPFLIVGLTFFHLGLLHENGSNNPLGITSKVNKIPFYPYFYVKDLFAFFMLIGIFSFLIFYYPNLLGHTDNYIHADSLHTPPHVVPEWYFLPFYAILRAIPHKLGGILAMAGSLIIFIILPFIQPYSIRSGHFRVVYQSIFWLFFVDFLLLMWLGPKPIEPPYLKISQFVSFFYFFIFLVGIPCSGMLDSYYLKKTFKK
jgi:ubiquinol-cytochrome c reductase cytochrome b subunit